MGVEIFIEISEITTNRNKNRFKFNKFVLLLGLILIGSIIISSTVSAAIPGTYPNTLVLSKNSETSQMGISSSHTNIQSESKTNTINTLNSKKNLKPDPAVIRGGVIIGSYTTIALALDAALSGDTIMLDPGNYNEHGLIIDKNLDFKVSNNGRANIAGGNVATIFNINSGVKVSFQNITLQNGNTSYYGGAINTMGNLTLINCSFKGNTAYDGGGAIYNGGNLTVKNCTFIFNNASNYAGGAIYNGYGSTLTMSASTFTGNNAIIYGGAIYTIGDMNITNSTFKSNNAQYGVGGAIYSTGNVNINASTFTSNAANMGGSAGAICSKGRMNITETSFTNNRCTFGGAIVNIEGSTMTVKSCTFKGNIAKLETSGNGGAIFNGGDLTAINNNFINNTSTYGGAIYNVGILNASSNNFINNTANNGGALYNSIGNSYIYFNRIIRNRANTGSAIESDGGSVNATLNWWGSNLGPALGNVVGTKVHSWLILKLYASPTSIGNNGHSTITADLRYTNLGLFAGNLLPDGIPITFKTNLGTITQASTRNGIAQSTLRIGTTAGKATISSHMDSQTISASVLVKDTIPPKVFSTTPTNKKTNVSRTSLIVIKFTENIKASTYYNKITIKNSAGKILTISKKSILKNTLYITTIKRSANTTYTLTIPRSAIKDYAANNLATTYTFTFKTGS